MEKIRADYINREISWLEFNKRVLCEAERQDNPIMERMKFLAITASNMDEFFMVKIAGIEQQIRCGIDERDWSGYTPKELLCFLEKQIRKFNKRQEKCFKKINTELERYGYIFVKMSELDRGMRKFASDYYRNEILPILTPMAVDNDRKFLHIEDRMLYVSVRLKEKNGGSRFVLVKIPKNIPAYIELPYDGVRRFIMTEELVAGKMGELFDIHLIESCQPFRLTRNSDVEIDDDAPDLIEEVKKSIKARKSGIPVRLELAKNCDSQTRDFLRKKLKLKKSDIFYHSVMIDPSRLYEFADIDCDADMMYGEVVPAKPPADFKGDNIFDIIKSRDCLVYHPYDSFDWVTDFLNCAADDENVLSIKQTLYRVSGNSPIIAALIRAARRGKQVTVLVELKARFDEKNNVEWAERLEMAGCNVIYGISGLKTHGKILSVIRNEDGVLNTYVHMATGNYNDNTAKTYTDIGLFTCDRKIAKDAAALFNMLTGYIVNPKYEKLVVAPDNMRDFLEERIENEIAYAKRGERSGIFIKVNSLTDTKIISLLYKASEHGVKITLLVRGMCCLIPKKEGLSENIRVVSIVGRLLEHSRIYRFENGGDKKVFLGSADIMPRNLNRRVEVIFPLEDDRLVSRLDEMIGIMMSDNKNMWIMKSDGGYELCEREENEIMINSQERLFDYARETETEEEKVYSD